MPPERVRVGEPRGTRGSVMGWSRTGWSGHPQRELLMPVHPAPPLQVSRWEGGREGLVITHSARMGNAWQKLSWEFDLV